MIVRDLFQDIPEEIIIARAIFEDQFGLKNVNGWITKYYSQLVKLKNCKVRKSNMMFYLSVIRDEGASRDYFDVSGLLYENIKVGYECYYAIECLNYRQYSSLYVPDYTVQCYGKEIVAAEALREFGWNGFDTSIVCSDETRLRVLNALVKMKEKSYPSDNNYHYKCLKQFRKAYEDKDVPQW